MQPNNAGQSLANRATLNFYIGVVVLMLALDNLNAWQNKYINITRACANKIQLLQAGDVDNEWTPYIPNMSKIKIGSINQLLNSIKYKKHHLKCFQGVNWKLDLKHPV